METPRGRVLSVYDDASPRHAVVEVVSSLRCARCAAGKGCGAGVLGGDSKLRRIDALIAGGVVVREGDEVRVELAPDNLLRAALIVYGLPLAGALVGAGVAYLIGAGDLGAAVSALGGIALGVAAGRARLRRGNCLRRFTPTVTARLAVAD